MDEPSFHTQILLSTLNIVICEMKLFIELRYKMLETRHQDIYCTRFETNFYYNESAQEI